MLVRARERERYTIEVVVLGSNTHNERMQEKGTKRNRFVQFWSWSGTKMKIKRINVSNVQ